VTCKSWRTLSTFGVAPDDGEIVDGMTMVA